jgi:hypothetical protein
MCIPLSSHFGPDFNNMARSSGDRKQQALRPSSKRQWLLPSAVIGCLLSLGALWYRSPTSPILQPVVLGRNGTVLFLTNEAPGHSNVHLATAVALVERYPDVEVHFASFPAMAKRISTASEQALKSRQKDDVPGGRGIIYHSLTSAPGFMDKAGGTYWDQVHTPGTAGLETSLRSMQTWIAPWSGPEYLALVDESLNLINEIDPAIVVLDTVYVPGREAVRKVNRPHAFICPIPLVFSFISVQPWAGSLWKFPAYGSDHPFPVPWHLIPTNMYMIFRVLDAVNRFPLVADFVRFVKDKNLPEAIKFDGMYRPDTPWISHHVPEASIEPDYLPDIVTKTPPIILRGASAEELDSELVKWMAQPGRRTMLINLGSSTLYDKARASAMVGAIKDILATQSDLQILWKYQLDYAASDGKIRFDNAAKDERIDEYTGPVQEFVDSGRLRLSTWLTVDPAAIMATGHIAAVVHHGGASSYWEAVE